MEDSPHSYKCLIIIFLIVLVKCFLFFYPTLNPAQSKFSLLVAGIERLASEPFPLLWW